jgi:hypothetical protein
MSFNLIVLINYSQQYKGGGSTPTLQRQDDSVILEIEFSVRGVKTEISDAFDGVGWFDGNPDLIPFSR